VYEEEEGRKKEGEERFLVSYRLGRSRAFVVGQVTRGLLDD
jgi:hypothetical protein